MKVTVTMKDPDCLDEAVVRAAEKSLQEQTGLSLGEQALVKEARVDEIRDKLYHWFTYGEYLDVEFDTEAMTATVLLAEKHR